MADYDVKGIYFFQGKENRYTGRFSIEENDQISGEIIDPASRCSRQEVEGQVKQLEDEVILEFLKSPTGDFVGLLSPIEYQMRKKRTNGDFSGNYEGAWRLPNPERCGRAGIGYDSEIGEVVVWIPPDEFENKSRLTLTARL